MNLNFSQGFWRLADPKISLASFASMFLGACAAAHEAPLHYGWLALTVLGIFAIEIAKNASGEVFDFDTGDDQAVRAEDRSPFSGGKRVLVDGILTRNQTVAIAVVSYLIGITAGLVIVFLRDPKVIWVGVVGVALAFLYHAPPIKFSYRGLGELAVTLAYGPVIGGGTYLVQRGVISAQVIFVSLFLGILIGAFLLINEFPDFHADKTADKQTWVVRLGRARASKLFAALIALPFLALLILPFFGYSFTLWLGFVAAPTAFSAARRLLRHPEDIQEIIPAQGNTLISFILFALGTGIGFLLS